MSSRLPIAVTRGVLALAEINGKPGRFKCAGYGRNSHGAYERNEVQVDHRIAEADGGAINDPDNLQVLCRDCHKHKTAREAQSRAKVVVVAAKAWQPWPLAIMIAMLYGAGFVIATGIGLIDGVEPAAAMAPLLAWRWAVVAVIIMLVLSGPLSRAARWWVRKGQPEPENPPAVESEGPDPLSVRVHDAVREVVGLKGDVQVSAGPQSIHITYTGTGFADHSDDKRADLVERVAAKVGGRWKPTWDTENDRVTLVRRPDLPPMVPHPGFEPGRDWNVIPVAPGVAFDLLNTSHLLIQGATGSGKTVLLRNIIAAFIDSASRGEAEIRIGDPKRIEMLGFRGKPGVGEIATSDEALWDLAIKTRDEMMDRYDQIEAGTKTQEDFLPILLVIDEYEEYVDRMRTYYVESGRKKASNNLPVAPALTAMQSILRMARKCHIHVVIGTQRPDADFFGGRARDNLQGRAGVGRLSPEASRMCFGDSSYGRDVPVSAKGRATFQVGDSEPVEAQTYYLPE